MTAFNNKFDNGMVAPLFDMVNISVGDCLMLSSMPPMIAAGVAYRWPNQYRNDMLGLDEDDPQRYKWPSAAEAKAYFESIGYKFPEGPEHRALPDARKEAIMAIAIHSEGIRASISDQEFEEMYADFENCLRQEKYREFHEWKEEMTQRHYENIHTHHYERTQQMEEELSTHEYEMTQMIWEGVNDDPFLEGPVPAQIVERMIDKEVERYRRALQGQIDKEISQLDEGFNEYIEQQALDMESEIQEALDYFRNSR